MNYGAAKATRSHPHKPTLGGWHPFGGGRRGDPPPSRAPGPPGAAAAAALAAIGAHAPGQQMNPRDEAIARLTGHGPAPTPALSRTLSPTMPAVGTGGGWQGARGNVVPGDPTVTYAPRSGAKVPWFAPEDMGVEQSARDRVLAMIRSRQGVQR